MIQMHNYELYFLNNLYSDTIISEFLGTFQNRLFTDVLTGKANIQKNVLKTGDIADFTVDDELNNQYGFPVGSYSMEFPYHIIPYYSEKAFIDKYGYGIPISSMEITKDLKVFTKAITFYLGDYFVYDVKLIFNRHSCTIVIPNTSEFPSSIIEDILNSDTEDKTWSLLWVSKSDYYYAYLTRASLISDNKIYVSKLTTKRILNKTKSNHWTLYLSVSNKFPNKMTSSSVTYVADTVNGDYFLLPDEFVSYIRDNVSGNLKCFITNNPECYGSGIYLHSASTEPIFQIPYKKNPVPVENLLIWKYDRDTKRKLRPIHNNITLTYPNIYDFTCMINDNDICIEWLEPIDDISAFDSYLQNYINCYQDSYANMIQNKTANERVLNFSPIDKFNFTSEEYFASKYHGDSRAWRLSKLIEIMQENPMRYEELMQRFYYMNREFVSESYTYETDPHIYERNIMDNREHCDNANERLMIFNKPHTFIKVHNSSCENRVCNLFINGVKKDITYCMPYGSDLYIYFPYSYIENHEDILVDIDLTNSNIENQSFRLDFTGGYYPFNRSVTMDNKCGADFVFYVGGSRKFIKYSDIMYRLSVLDTKIQYIGSSEVETITIPASDKIYFTSQNEVYDPEGFDFIVLATENTNIEIPNSIFYKKINLDDLEICVTNPSYEENDIYIANVDFHMIRTFTITDENINSTFEIVNFKGKPISERFHLYLDGVLINPNLYNIQFPKIYNGTVKISNIQFGTGKLVVEYISYDETILYNGKIKDLRKTDDDILYLDDIINTPMSIDAYKIYVDGYRIHSSQIHTLGQNNMITINDFYHELYDDSNIVIYAQTMDTDPYEYDSSLHFLSEVSKEDDTFRNYLLETFGK